MKDKLKPVSLVYIAYALYVIQSMIRWVNGVGFLKALMLYSVPALLFVVFLCSVKSYRIGDIIRSFVLIVLGFIVGICTGDYALSYLALFIAVSKEINFSKLIKLDLLIKISMVVVVMILYNLGLTEQVVMHAKNGSLIYAFGFGNPNTFGVYLFGICADLIYLNYRKRNKLIYLIALCMAFFINVFCDSRSSFACILLMIAFSIIDPFKSKNKYLKAFIVSIPILLLITSVVLVKMYDAGVPFAVSLNGYLSQRIALASTFWQHYGVSLFGNYFEGYNTINGVSVNWVLDNAYLMLLVRFGLVATLLLIGGIMKHIVASYKKNDHSSILGILAFSAFGLMENGLFILFYNPFLLSLSDDFGLTEGGKNE